MSGIDGTGREPPPEPGNCETLVIDTQVVSPRAGVISSIVVGDLLDVALDQSGATVVVLHNGVIAGGLMAPAVPRLRRCVELGTRYVARVVARQDALVRVRVSAVRS